ncbi:MAG: alpha-L-arabinofuranosidase C-terminal domain-containing protein, partial [bacterium]
DGGGRDAGGSGGGRRGGLGRIRVAFDEWNLRGWHHPAVDTGLTPEEYLAPRDENDDNSVYTMADAVFSACFLNACLRNADIVGMANFAPVVNTRGAIFTHPEGIVLRTTFHVFEMYWSMTGDTVIDSWIRGGQSEGGGAIEAGERKGATVRGGETAGDRQAARDGKTAAAQLDCVATRGGDGVVSFAIANRSRVEREEVTLSVYGLPVDSAEGRTLSGPEADSYNSIEHPQEVIPETLRCAIEGNGRVRVVLPPHSVSVIRVMPAEAS